MGNDVPERKKQFETIRAAEELIRVPKRDWSLDLEGTRVGEYVRIQYLVGPEGYLLRMICEGCWRKHALLLRPETPVSSLDAIMPAVKENPKVPARLERWVRTHADCLGVDKPLNLPGNIAKDVELFEKRANAALKDGKSAGPTVMVTGENQRTMLIDTREVSKGETGKRYLEGFLLIAALREMMRRTGAEFTSLVFYHEGYAGDVHVESEGVAGKGDDSPFGQAISDGAVDERGRHEIAVLDIETRDRRYGGQAPIIRRSGVSEKGPGELGRFHFMGGMRNAVFDDAFVEEIPVPVR